MKKKPPSCDTIWTIKKLLDWAIPYFESRGIDSPRTTSEILLAYTLKIKRIDLYLQYEKPLTDSELSTYKGLIKRRLNREPLAYIIGEKGFWSLTLNVSKGILIPRPDTECLVEAALDAVSKKNNAPPQKILELGVGSGAITLAIAKDKPDNIYYASDLSMNALKTAKLNQAANFIDAKINYVQGNWFGPFSKDLQPFNIVISNPPYIPSNDIPTLQKEICDFEPVLALDGGVHGLDCIELIIDQAVDYLLHGGYLLLEIGYDQKDRVEKIIEKSGLYDDIKFITDLGGNHRVVTMRKNCN